MSSALRRSYDQLSAILPLPTMEKYLAQLPEGMSSYPGCLAKGSLVQSMLASPAMREFAHRMPFEICELYRSPPTVSGWVPEVVHCLLLAAQRDICHRHEREFMFELRDTYLALFRTSLYRSLMLAASPAQLLRGLAIRWQQFHRGTNVKVSALSDTEASLLIDHPASLFDSVPLHGIGVWLEAALISSSGDNATHVLDGQSETTSRIHLRWREIPR